VLPGKEPVGKLLGDGFVFNQVNSLAQEITNRAILTLKGNRNKSAINAEKFLTTVKDQFPSALEMQCIPDNKDLCRIEHFKEFLQKRRGILAAAAQ